MAEPVQYQIQIEGWLDRRWAGWFEGLDMSLAQDGQGQPVTILTTTLADQAALRGILAKIWDLNLAVRSVSRLQEKGARGNE